MRGSAVFIYDYPCTQASLARVRDGDPPVGERFELFVNGIELANGFHELTDANEQRQRFESELTKRRERGMSAVPLDKRLLHALECGLPRSAGVALGVDRLVMLAGGASTLQDVLSFPDCVRLDTLESESYLAPEVWRDKNRVRRGLRIDLGREI